MTSQSDIRVVHNVAERRYELHVGPELASVTEYRASGDTLIFDHTFTRRRFRGKNLAARLVASALDDVRRRRLLVVPVCWFVAGFIDENPEYRSLLSHGGLRSVRG